MDRAPERLNPALLDGNSEFANYGPTLYSLVSTITSASYLPAALLFIAWQLDPPYQKQSLPGAIGFSLVTTAIPLLFVMLVISRSVTHNGLAERFLRWSPNVCQAILATTTCVVWVCLPLLWF